MKKLQKFTSFLSIFSLLYFSLFIDTQLINSIAQANDQVPPVSMTPVPNLTNYLNSQDLEDPKLLALLKEHEHVVSALDDKRIEDIPKKFIDSHHIAGQEVELIREEQTFNLDNYVNDIKSMAVDEINVVSKDGQLVLEGLQDGQVVARHKINGLDPVTHVRDKDFLIILNRDGSIFAIDTGHLVGEIFKGILPVYKIYESGENAPVKLDTTKEHKLTFLTRGMKPLLMNEIEDAKKPLVPKSVNNNAKLAAGDLIIYEKGAGGRNLKAILNRETIRSIVVQGTVELAMASFLASHEGHGKTIGEKINNALRIDSPDGEKAPIEELLALFENPEIIKHDTQKESVELTQIMKRSLQSFDRKQIKRLINRAQVMAAKKGAKTDEFTLKQWFASYERITSQADKELENVEKRLETEKGFDRLELEGIQKDLKEAYLEGDFRDPYQQLLLSDLQGSTFSNKGAKIKWHKKIPYKGLAKLAGKLTLLSAATYGVYLGLDASGLSHSTQFHIFTNWVNEKLIFEQLGTHPAYIKPLVLGTISMAMIIPVVAVYGHFSVQVMYMWSKMFAGFKNTPGKLSESFKNISYRLRKSAEHFKDKTFSQRIVTYSTRPYAALIYPFYNRISNWLKQQATLSFANQINPFMKITPDSVIGKKIGMKEGDNSFRVGVNAPRIKSSDALKAKHAIQQKAMSEVVKETRVAKDYAFSLAMLVASKEKNIDPATLTMLMNNEMTIEDLKRVQNDPALQKKWVYVFNSLIVDFSKLIRRPDKSVVDINPEDLEGYYKKALEYSSQIDNNQKIKVAATNLRNRFVLNLKKAGEFMANFAKEDYEKLSSMTSNKLVGNQTWAEFWQDHLIVATLPAVYGERADLNFHYGTEPRMGEDGKMEYPDPRIMSHGDDHFLWTTPAHGTDMFNNTMLHLIIAGPRRMLVYQTLKAQTETNYIPLEKILLNAVDRPEDFGVALYRWGKEVSNFKKSNLGAYYSKDFLKKFTTIQAMFALSVIFRVYVGEQPFESAMRAWLLFTVAGTLAFGWPWDVIMVGNQMEEERVGAHYGRYKKVQESISNALLNDDDEALKAAYLELSDFYRSKDSHVKKNLNKIFEQQMGQIQGLKGMQNKILKSIRKGKMTPLLLAKLVEMDHALKNNRRNEAFATIRDFEKLINGDMSEEEIEEALQKNLRKNARMLVDFSIENPITPTRPNKLIANLTTFVLGAVGTTAMAISLSVDSFNESKLTMSNIGVEFTHYIMFLVTLFTFASKQGLSKIEESLKWLEKQAAKLVPPATKKASRKRMTTTRKCRQSMLDILIARRTE